MPWFRVDDKHHDHRKTRKALRGAQGKRRDAGAMGLWELAGSWSADNLMDGFVPTDELFRWDDDALELAARLVDADYWEPAERAGEEGFQFINWEDHQPMKAEVEAKREAARERMRNIRSGSRDGSREVRANQTGTITGSSPTPSRPVPSRPDPTPTTDEPSAGKPRRKRPATTLPADWTPTDEHHDRAVTTGINLEREVASFKAHADTHDRRCVNWNAAFTQWLLKAQPTSQAGQPHQGAASRWLQLATELGDDTPPAQEIGSP